MRRPRGLEAAVTSPRFAGLPVRVPGVTGLPFTRFQETRFLVTRNKVSSYKKQEKLVWCVVEEGPSLHLHTDGRTVSPQFLPFQEALRLRSKVRIPLLADFLFRHFRAVRAQSRARL